MAGCNSCGKSTKQINVNNTPTNIVNAIPVEDRMEVIYLGGRYSHRIVSPHGALYPYKIANYGTGQYGKKMIIHRNDYPPKDGVKLFEEVVQPVSVQNEVQVESKPVAKKKATKSLFEELK